MFSIIRLGNLFLIKLFIFCLFVQRKGIINFTLLVYFNRHHYNIKLLYQMANKKVDFFLIASLCSSVLDLKSMPN